MRLSLFVPLFLAAGTLAAPIDTVQNDAAIINRALSEINTALKHSTTAVDNLRKAPHNTDLTNYEREVEFKAKDVSAAFTFHADAVRRGPDVSAFETPRLLPSLVTLQRDISSYADSFVSAKRLIITRPGGKEAIARILTDFQVVNGAFTDALKAKLPAGNTLATGQTVDSIKRAVRAFS